MPPILRVGSEPVKPLSQKKGIDLLRRNGWEKKAGGKHGVKMVKQGQRPITLPKHKGSDYGPGLTRAILKQAGLEDQWN